jgi:hypothetical protein
VARSGFPFLLDNSRLEGAHAVERVVGPECVAAAVDRAELADAHAAISELCMTWGGVCGALLPAERGARDFHARWQRFLDNDAFDQLTHREHRKRQSPWLRSLRGEREDFHDPERDQLSAVERVAVGMVLIVVIAFELWFFFFSSSPIDQRSGRG